MKKFKIAALGIAAMIALTACSGSTKTDTSVNNSNVAVADNKEAAAVKDIYDEIAANVSLISPMEPTADFIYNYYGIDTASLDEYVFEMSEEATSAEAVIIIKCQDAELRSTITDGLNMLREDKMLELESYLPDQYTIVADSSVATSGDYVYLVISENAQDILSIIKSHI